MKKNVMKTMVAAICVVAAGMGGMKAYNAANQDLSKADMLLAENVEALSWDEGDAIDACITRSCPVWDPSKWCDFYCPTLGTACFYRQG